MLALSLEQAEDNIKILAQNNYSVKVESEEISIPLPFNICILGEVSDEELIIQDLQKYFVKHKVPTNEWDIKFFNNSKLQNGDILRSLIKGQSRYSIIVTGQIFHHSGKGNKKANIVSELKNEKYVDHLVGTSPTDKLTPDKLLKAIDSYLVSQNSQQIA